MKKINPYIKTFCKISLVLLFLFTSISLFAQNVGINSTGATPNTAAILDLNTGNTFTSPAGMGLLIPNVALTGVADAVTITLPPTSLLVYVPTGSGLTPAGYYYNAGTPGTPNWTALSGGGAIGGSGTLNYLARWTPNSTTLGIGVTRDNGTTVGINAAPVGTQMLTVLQATAANTAIVGKNSAAAGTNNGIGVFGISSQAYAAGPVNGYGVVAENNNANGTGLFATGNNIGFINYLLAGSGAAIIGSNVGAFSWANAAAGSGIVGEASGANSTGIEASGNNFAPNALAAGSGAAFTGGTVGCFAIANTGAGNTGFIGQEDGEQTYVSYWSGAIYYKTIATGAATNSCSVPDLNGNYVCMHAPETPECYFEDYGQGQLVNGKTHINLDPVLAKNVTIDEKHPLRVYVQLEGNCKGVYVTNKTITGFDVVELDGGTSNVPFQYHIICNMANVKMADGEIAKYSDARFEPAPKFQPSHTDPNLKTVLPVLDISSKP